MAGAMHKMAVYLGLVEDDPRYEDGYDSYEEYEDEYGEPAEAAEPEADRPASRGRGEFLMDPAPPAAPRASATATATPPMCPGHPMPPISPGSPPCTRARTMKPGPSESTSVRAFR